MQKEKEKNWTTLWVLFMCYFSVYVFVQVFVFLLYVFCCPEVDHSVTLAEKDLTQGNSHNVSWSYSMPLPLVPWIQQAFSQGFEHISVHLCTNASHLHSRRQDVAENKLYHMGAGMVLSRLLYFFTGMIYISALPRYIVKCVRTWSSNTKI